MCLVCRWMILSSIGWLLLVLLCDFWESDVVMMWWWDFWICSWVRVGCFVKSGRVRRYWLLSL